MKQLLPVLLCTLILLSGCAGTPGQTPDQPTQSPAVTQISSTVDAENPFSNRDLDPSYEDGIAITLNGDSALCSSEAVSIQDGQITISDEGVYIISGTLNDGQITVSAEKTDKVQIVLNGADITCSTSAAIYAKTADKVFITLADSTENTLTNGGSYAAIDDNNIDGVIFAKTDLTLNGGGSLTVNAAAGHGIVCKDELVITGGSYTVNSGEHSIAAKDSLAIAAGSFSLNAKGDGIHCKNSDDETLGWLLIVDGTFDINSQGDGISSTGSVQLDGGTYAITTGGSSEAVTMKAGDSWGMRPGMQTTTTTQDTESCKGIKTDGTLVITGGTFQMDTADDALHAAGDILINGGEFTIHTGDDGIHSDNNVTLKAGTFSIPYCYEGVEGLTVTVDGGTIDIIAHDDGINAADGTDSSGGMRPGSFGGNSSCAIVVGGGQITIVSDGDCLDSNGSITLNGGTLNLTCNRNGNTAIDSDGSYTNNGASVTTNDGSENGGGMGGNMRPGGPFGGTKPEGGKPDHDTMRPGTV